MIADMFTSAAEKIQKWKNDPVSMVEEEFGVTPDPWQTATLKALPNEKRIAMKACKGPGKTAVLAWCAWNFLATRPFPKIAATSISKENLSDNFWTEMAKWQHKSKFLSEAFIWTKTRIFAKNHPENWWMSARAWSKSADKQQQSDTLAGLHADYMLFIIDEVGGIPDSVMAAAEAGLATGVDTKIIIAGNPTKVEGPLYRACTNERDLWHVVEITGDPDNPQRSSRISKKWAQEQIDKYGRDNPWVLVNVFGKFPPSSINSLLGVEEVSDAIGRGLKKDQYSFAQKRIGIDVARFGDDRTVIFPRQGLAAFTPAVMRNADSADIAARVAQAKVKWNSEMELVDGSGGFGGGVVDFMRKAGYSPFEISFSSKPIDPKYLNRRAEMWMEMADWVRKGGALPSDLELQKELTAPMYTFTSKGQFQLESKMHIKERLGFSPDKADALALTFAFPDQIAKELAFAGHNKSSMKIKHEWDPFDDSRF